MLRRKHPTISVLANLLRLAESRSVRESQRDSVPKPRVARHELPWVIVRETSPTATRLRPVRSRPRAGPQPQRRRRCFLFRTRTQGKRRRANPGLKDAIPLGLYVHERDSISSHNFTTPSLHVRTG